MRGNQPGRRRSRAGRDTASPGNNVCKGPEGGSTKKVVASSTEPRARSPYLKSFVNLGATFGFVVFKDEQRVTVLAWG